MDIAQIATQARAVAQTCAHLASEQKNGALRAMAEALNNNRDRIALANQQDMARAKEKGLPGNLIDRLAFGPAKIDSRIESLRKIAALPDPVGSQFWHREIVGGMKAKRMRVPLGVILMIYEARPHVSINAGAFCLKAGNASILRGGSEARGCNELLGKLWQESLASQSIPAEAIQLIAGSHQDIHDLLQHSDEIDLVIPRGGRRLIETVVADSKIPVVKHFTGQCHVYIDESADIDKAIGIVIDSKCLMPEVCNAMEVTLVAEALRDQIPRIAQAFTKAGVAIKGDRNVCSIIPEAKPAAPEDWTEEHLGKTVTLGVVQDLDAAIDHINTYGSHHTDSIVTSTPARADRFVARVDSGVVLVNASTMYCDGESLGMGAEIGISTDRIHARGPMGLEELTTYKFVIEGTGNTMSNPGEFMHE